MSNGPAPRRPAPNLDAIRRHLGTASDHADASPPRGPVLDLDRAAAGPMAMALATGDVVQTAVVLSLDYDDLAVRERLTRAVGELRRVAAAMGLDVGPAPDPPTPEVQP